METVPTGRSRCQGESSGHEAENGDFQERMAVAFMPNLLGSVSRNDFIVIEQVKINPPSIVDHFQIISRKVIGLDHMGETLFDE